MHSTSHQCGCIRQHSDDLVLFWVNTTGGSNYSIPVPGAAGSLGKENPLAGFEDDLSRTIVDCEVNADQWTLMHRYNKATELIGQALNVSTNDTSCSAIIYSIAQLSHSSTLRGSQWQSLHIAGM